MTPWHLRDHVRVLPGGELLVHALVFLLGAGFIVLGLLLVVLPGPLTIPPILLGVFIWSLEFAFAERLLVRVRASAQTAWQAARARPVATGLLSAAGLLLAAGAVILIGRYGVGGSLQVARDAFR